MVVDWLLWVVVVVPCAHVLFVCWSCIARSRFCCALHIHTSCKQTHDDIQWSMKPGLSPTNDDIRLAPRRRQPMMTVMPCIQTTVANTWRHTHNNHVVDGSRSSLSLFVQATIDSRMKTTTMMKPIFTHTVIHRKIMNEWDRCWVGGERRKSKQMKKVLSYAHRRPNIEVIIITPSPCKHGEAAVV